MYEQQSSSYNRINGIANQANQQISAIQNTTGLKSILAPRMSEVSSNAAAETGVIRAAISARGQNISAAKNDISAASKVIEANKSSAITYYNNLSDFYSTQQKYASDFLKTAMKDHEKLADEQADLLKEDLDRSREVAEYLQDMMIDPATATIMEQSGVTLLDSFESINKKMSDHNYWTEIQEKENKFQEAGYERLSTNSQLAGLANSEVMRIVDSRGVERLYKRPQTSQQRQAELEQLKSGLRTSEAGYNSQLEMQEFAAKEEIQRATTAWEETLGRETYAYKADVDVAEAQAKGVSKAEIDTQVSAYEEQLKRETNLSDAEIDAKSDQFKAELDVWKTKAKEAIKKWEYPSYSSNR